MELSKDMKTALITGIAGQDGSYLAEHLLDVGLSVHGLVRRNSVPEHQESRISHLSKYVKVHYADINDVGGLDRILNTVQPDEIYNLAAQSHVRISYEIPYFTSQTNSLGVLNLLELIRNSYPAVKFYQASSSEMFGDSVDLDNFQRETTPMHPVSPYGCAKLYGYHITRNYRKAFSLFSANGILFNHESPRRGSNFVSSKIIKTAVQIKLKQEDKLVLGNLDSYRDWGHSQDYVRAMKMILDHSIPDDFVVATGITRSVRELLELVFKNLELNYEDYVTQDQKYIRPEELPYLKGDSSKIRSVLGWEPRITFEEMVLEMVQFWFDKLSEG
jgi:GDPmannose 4,6-dehydratase